MAKTTSQSWRDSISQGVVSSIIASILIGVVVMIASHLGSTWAVPAIHGGFAAMLTLAILLGIKAIKHLPNAPKATTLDNIEQRVRTWLDNFHLAVRNSPLADTYFHFVVTTDGGKKIGIARSKTEWTEYLGYFANISPDDDEKKVIAQLTPLEKSQTMVALKLELARARMGYSGFALEGFTISKRIPISGTLSESTVIETVWEMEAMLNALFMIAAKTTIGHEEVSKAIVAEKNSDETRIP